MDMETKVTSKDQSNHPTAVRLFERAVHINLSTKKMKFFFKKYLKFQKQFGGLMIAISIIFLRNYTLYNKFIPFADEEGQNRVKDLARAFVQKQNSSANS